MHVCKGQSHRSFFSGSYVYTLLSVVVVLFILTFCCCLVCCFFRQSTSQSEEHQELIDQLHTHTKKIVSLLVWCLSHVDLSMFVCSCCCYGEFLSVLLTDVYALGDVGKPRAFESGKCYAFNDSRADDRH